MIGEATPLLDGDTFPLFIGLVIGERTAAPSISLGGIEPEWSYILAYFENDIKKLFKCVIV